MPSSTMAAAAPSSARPTTGRSPGKTPATAADANGPVAQQELNQHFATRVQELRHAGNWNVLVLYASDWTRKQPENGTAWKELSVGYANMRQFDDAYEAAKKAVQLTPGDPGAWRNLGLIDVELEQPVAALEAFEKATLLDDQDLQSLVQVGVLNAQLGRLPAARAAFGRVLAANPENVDALCGEASIARKEGRVKDAEALARQLKSVDGTCRDANEGSGTTVAHGTATSSVKAPAPMSTAASRRPTR
jgi:tetratricopeptide (TPR) repeat protein